MQYYNGVYINLLTFYFSGGKKAGKYTLDQIEVEDFRDSEEEDKQSFSELSEPEVGILDDFKWVLV